MTSLLVVALLILAISSCLPGDRKEVQSPTLPPVATDRPMPTTTIEIPPPI